MCPELIMALDEIGDSPPRTNPSCGATRPMSAVRQTHRPQGYVARHESHWDATGITAANTRPIWSDSALRARASAAISAFEPHTFGRTPIRVHQILSIPRRRNFC